MESLGATLSRYNNNLSWSYLVKIPVTSLIAKPPLFCQWMAIQEEYSFFIGGRYRAWASMVSAADVNRGIWGSPPSAAKPPHHFAAVHRLEAVRRRAAKPPFIAPQRRGGAPATEAGARYGAAPEGRAAHSGRDGLRPHRETGPKELHAKTDKRAALSGH